MLEQSIPRTPFPTKKIPTSLPEYISITKKLISKICKSTKNADKIWKDEDSFSHVLYNVISADYFFDGRGTIHGYRKQRAIYAIKELGRRTIDHINVSEKIFELTPSSQKSPEEEVIRNELIENIQEEARQILTDKEYEVYKYRYDDGLTYREIAEKMNKTYQNTGLTMNRIRRKLGFEF